MFLKTSQYWSLFLIKLQAFFLQNTYGCCFWIFAAAKTSFSLIPRFHLGKMKIFHMNTRKWASPASRDSMARLSGKNNFFTHKIFSWRSIVLFLSTRNTFLCNINTFLSTPNYFLCNVKLFASTENYFSLNTKFLFWTSFRMLCHGDIFLLSRSNNHLSKNE